MGGKLGFCFSMILICALVARADTASFTPDKDNTLIQSATGNLSDGAAQALYAGRTNQSGNIEIRRGLLHFNLSSLPANATITAASLRLVAENRGDNGNRTMILHRVDQDWGQGTSNSAGIGATATTNDATWIYRFYVPTSPASSPAWTTQGGTFEKADSATSVCLNAGGPFTFNGTNLSTMVGDLNFWLANPTSNFGWVLLGDEGSQGTAKKIYSREYPTVASRPTLTITYVVPEPSSLLLFSGLASLLTARRRPGHQ